MVLATIFVSLPFVVREVVPVLREIGDEQEQAAATLGASSWQTFWRVTLPAIRWGVAYGVVLTTARALGEFGAVSVVSGRIAGRTETMTLHVEERFQALRGAGRLRGFGRARAPRRRDAPRDDSAPKGRRTDGDRGQQRHEALRRLPRARRRLRRRRERLADRAARPERQREVDAAPRDRRARAARRRRGLHLGRGGDDASRRRSAASASSSSTTRPSST